MPTVSPAQHRLMEGVAHNKSFASAVGIPQKVGKEFASADENSAHEAHREVRDHHERMMKQHHEMMEDAHAKMMATHPDEHDALREHNVHHLSLEKYHTEMAGYHEGERVNDKSSKDEKNSYNGTEKTSDKSKKQRLSDYSDNEKTK